jgi:hypothetical protein
MSDDDEKVRFRIRVRGGRGAASLEPLVRAAEDLKQQALQDARFWEEAAAMAEEFRRQIKALNRDKG